MANNGNHPLKEINTNDLLTFRDMLTDNFGGKNQKTIKDTFSKLIAYPPSIESFYAALTELNTHGALPVSPMGFLNGRKAGRSSDVKAFSACKLPFENMPLYLSHPDNTISFIVKWRL